MYTDGVMTVTQYLLGVRGAFVPPLLPHHRLAALRGCHRGAQLLHLAAVRRGEGRALLRECLRVCKVPFRPFRRQRRLRRLRRRQLLLAHLQTRNHARRSLLRVELLVGDFHQGGVEIVGVVVGGGGQGVVLPLEQGAGPPRLECLDDVRENEESGDGTKKEKNERRRPDMEN